MIKWEWRRVCSTEQWTRLEIGKSKINNFKPIERNRICSQYSLTSIVSWIRRKKNDEKPVRHPSQKHQNTHLNIKLRHTTHLSKHTSTVWVTAATVCHRCHTTHRVISVYRQTAIISVMCDVRHSLIHRNHEYTVNCTTPNRWLNIYCWLYTPAERLCSVQLIAGRTSSKSHPQQLSINACRATTRIHSDTSQKCRHCIISAFCIPNNINLRHSRRQNSGKSFIEVPSAATE